MAQGSAGSGFCSQCGERLEPGANFCGHCGAPVASPAVSRPASAGGPKATTHIKYRNMLVQVLLVIITLGIYTVYWFYVTLGELYRGNGRPKGAGLWTILTLVPIAQYFSYWHYANEYTEFVDEKYPAIAVFLLWTVFSPAVWFLVQSDLNQVANRES